MKIKEFNQIVRQKLQDIALWIGQLFKRFINIGQTTFGRAKQAEETPDILKSNASNHQVAPTTLRKRTVAKDVKETEAVRSPEKLDHKKELPAAIPEKLDSQPKNQKELSPATPKKVQSPTWTFPAKWKPYVHKKPQDQIKDWINIYDTMKVDNQGLFNYTQSIPRKHWLWILGQEFGYAEKALELAYNNPNDPEQQKQLQLRLNYLKEFWKATHEYIGKNGLTVNALSRIHRQAMKIATIDDQKGNIDFNKPISFDDLMNQLKEDPYGPIAIIYAHPNPNAKHGLSTERFVEALLLGKYPVCLSEFNMHVRLPKTRTKHDPHFSEFNTASRLGEHDLSHARSIHMFFRVYPNITKKLKNIYLALVSEKQKLTSNDYNLTVSVLFLITHEIIENWMKELRTGVMRTHSKEFEQSSNENRYKAFTKLMHNQEKEQDKNLSSFMKLALSKLLYQSSIEVKDMPEYKQTIRDWIKSFFATDNKQTVSLKDNSGKNLVELIPYTTIDGTKEERPMPIVRSKADNSIVKVVANQDVIEKFANEEERQNFISLEDIEQDAGNNWEFPPKTIQKTLPISEKIRHKVMAKANENAFERMFISAEDIMKRIAPEEFQ